MNKDSSILVVGGNGGGVAEGLLKALRLAGYTNLAVLDHRERALHLYRVEHRFVLAEDPDTDGYVERVVDYCRGEKIRVIVPGSTWEARAFARCGPVLAAAGIVALTNNIGVIDTCRDRWLSHQFFVDNGIPAPRSALRGSSGGDDSLELPIVVKPRRGRGSRDVHVVQTEEELACVLRLFELRGVKAVLQEYVDGVDREYTVGVVSDKHGEVVDSFAMQRFLAGGYTDNARVKRPSGVNRLCEDVARRLGSTGPLNIQLRVDPDGVPRIFEINPRFSGSAPMRAAAGFNEPDMILRNFLFAEPLERARGVNYDLEFYRAFQEYYIDHGVDSSTAHVCPPARKRT